MTILGFRTDADRGFAWTDSEMFCPDTDRGAEPTYRNKLTANGLGCFVMLSCGWAHLADRAAETVHRAASVDEAAVLLPEVLRRETVRIIRHADPRDAWRQSVFLLGWSDRSDRVLGYRLDGAAFFAPVLASSVCHPHADAFSTLRTPDPRKLLGVAKEQIADLRERHPDATGGTLTVAEVARGTIVTRTLFGLAAGRSSPGVEA